MKIIKLLGLFILCIISLISINCGSNDDSPAVTTGSISGTISLGSTTGSLAPSFAPGSQGSAVNGASVYAVDYDGNSYGPATSDANGAFTITGLPAGKTNFIIKAIKDKIVLRSMVSNVTAGQTTAIGQVDITSTALVHILENEIRKETGNNITLGDTGTIASAVKERITAINVAQEKNVLKNSLNSDSSSANPIYVVFATIVAVTENANAVNGFSLREFLTDTSKNINVVLSDGTVSKNNDAIDTAIQNVSLAYSIRDYFPLNTSNSDTSLYYYYPDVVNFPNQYYTMESKLWEKTRTDYKIWGFKTGQSVGNRSNDEVLYFSYTGSLTFGLGNTTQRYTLAPSRIAVGDTWLFTNSGGLWPASVVTFLGFDTVTVTAGTFANCIKLKLDATTNGKMIEYWYFAKNVGLVKSVNEQQTGYNPQDQDSFFANRNLISYYIGTVVLQQATQYTFREYFPLNTSNSDTWLYRYYPDDINNPSFYYTMTSQLWEKTRTDYKIWGFKVGQSTGTRTNDEVLYCAYSGAVTCGLGNTTQNRLIAPDTMIVGDSWTFTSVWWPAAKVSFMGLENVTVPAGTFNDCIKLKLDATTNGKMIEYWYFAKNVGLVKTVNEQQTGYNPQDQDSWFGDRVLYQAFVNSIVY